MRSFLCLIARSARCGSRLAAAYFVVAHRRKRCLLAPPQHGGARSGASDDDEGGSTARCASSPKKYSITLGLLCRQCLQRRPQAVRAHIGFAPTGAR
jgi:hypothetical protein